MSSKNLPLEITTQILSQLPVKSLLRFKCVSKSWKTIIESPEFFKLHSKRALKINYYNSSLILTIYRNITITGSPTIVRSLYRAYLSLNDTKLNICKVSLPPSFNTSLESITMYKNYHINRPEKLVFGKIEVVGSCNGLVLIVSGINHIAVCNPALDQQKGSFKILPCINYCYAPYYYNAPDCHERSYWLSNGIRNYTAIRYFRFRVFGLGYDCISNCYKVVGLSAKRALIYTLLKDSRSWREINLPVLNNSFLQPGNTEKKLFTKAHNHGIALNNHLHWHITEYDPLIFGYSKEKILNFDLHTENWGELAVPDEINQGYYLHGCISKPYIIELGMLNGCLCILISRGISYDYLELWVMKVYGVKNSWEKLCNVPNGSGIPLIHRKEQQEFLLPGAQHGLGWYNLKEKRVRKVEFHGCEFTGEHYYSTSVKVCTESFVHPFSNMDGVEPEKMYQDGE
ncbi:unnamed protein product [Amaranthus hypochondriacus]